MAFTAPRVGLFEHLTRDLNDLLTRDFVPEKTDAKLQKYDQKLQWKGITSKGMILDASFYKSSATGETLGRLCHEYNYFPWRTSFFGELTTDKNLTLTAVSREVAPGLTTTVSGKVKDQEAFGIAAVDYQHPQFAASASADFGKQQGSTTNASLVIGRPWLQLGAYAEYFLGRSGEPTGLKENRLVLSHSSADFQAHAFHRIDAHPKDDVRNEIGVGYFHRVSSDLAAGAEYVADVSKHRNPTLTVGVQYRAFEDTVLKAKMDTNGLLEVSALAAKWNSDTSVLVSTSVDTKHLGDKGSARIGWALTFGEAGLHYGHKHPEAPLTVPPHVAVVPAVAIVPRRP